jgi:amino acid adenylation domain-containing protein
MSHTLQNSLDLSPEEKRALLADLLRTKAAKSRRAPVSFAQQRLWFLDQFESDGAAFNISQALRLIGPLDEPALVKSLNALIARHEPLRTNFELLNAEPVQVINPPGAVNLSFVDLRDLPRDDRDDREAAVSRLIAESIRRAFDLSHDPLLRANLFQLGDHEHVLLLTMHHIVSDGWSMGVLFRELGALYEAFVNGRQSPLTELPIQYSDFAVWQRDWLRGEVLETQLAYWRKQLAGAPAVLELPTDKPRPLIQTFNGTYHSKILSPGLGDFLSEFSRREGVTLFMTLLAAFQTLLYRYTNQEDIVVGTPIANRTRKETEGLIGFFVNTLVLRTDCSGNPTFRQLLRRVREVALEAYAHQDIPFEKLVEELKPERSLNRMPLFQTLFAVQNAPKSILKLTNLELQEFPLYGKTAKFDLSLYVGETSEGLRLTFEYNTDIFNATTVARIAGHLETLLLGIFSNPDERLANLPLLTEPEGQRLLVDWNQTQVDYPRRCINELFEEQARVDPTAIAVVCDEEQISFVELDRRANQLAHYLQKRGIGPEVLVAICVERSVEMVVAMLGVLKAGGAFVPVDPSYPAERVAFLLEDSRARIVLTQSAVQESLPAFSGETICLDTGWREIAGESEEAPASGATAENAAYVIYTSGSTGKPKASISPHHASLNRFTWMWRTYPFTADEVCCQKTSLSFADSIWECFGPLLRGVPLVIIADEVVSDPRRLVETLADRSVTRIVLVPSLLRAILEQEKDLARKLPLLQRWVCSGEALPLDLAQSFRLALPDAVLINLYGSSELAADVTCYEIRAAEELHAIPIGSPIDNIAAYILDDRFYPVPVGVPGELYIAGAGLARGYLGHTELTSEKFLPCPFANYPGARMFRTGDLARYREDGNIEFLRRADDQVKLRGFRVEMGEVEAALKTHASVKDAASALRQVTESNQILVGYVVTAGEFAGKAQPQLTADLRSWLQQTLPEYMVPGAFVFLECLPRTPSGKIDRRALPEPDSARPGLEEDHTAPRDLLEQRLAHIWEKLLGVQAIGISDNFFELGGHSLLAVRVVSEIEKEFGQRIPLISFFQGATIEYLAELLRRDVRSFSWPTLIEIQPGAVKPAAAHTGETPVSHPLFCVSAPNVNALGYRSLARYLGPDQPVYGLQAQYPEDLDGEHSRAAVDDLATEYLEALVAARPHGPYEFVGQCRGAHIAYEMARRLKKRGEQVALLGVLDTWVLENTYNRFLYVEYYAKRLRSFLRSGFREQLRFLTEKVTGVKDGTDVPPLSGGRLPGAGVKGVATNRKNPMSAYFPGPDFVPKTYDGEITVFRVRAQPLNRIRDPQLGWGKLTTGGVDVHIVPGNHGVVLSEPNVRGLAEELKKCLSTATPATK